MASPLHRGVPRHGSLAVVPMHLFRVAPSRARIRMRNAAPTALLTSLLLALVGHLAGRLRARQDARAARSAAGPAGRRRGQRHRRPVRAHPTRAPPAVRRLGVPRRHPEGRPRDLREINRALGSLERAEPGLVGAASAIGLDGRERARVVRGESAPAEALARDVRNARLLPRDARRRSRARCTSRSPTARPTRASWSSRTRRSCATTAGPARHRALRARARERRAVRPRPRSATSSGVEVALVDRDERPRDPRTRSAASSPGMPDRRPAYRHLASSRRRPRHASRRAAAVSPTAR